MKQLILYIFLLFSTTVFSQVKDDSNKPINLLGCENPKGKQMKMICSTKKFGELYQNYTSIYIKKYIDRIPQGKARLSFIISKEGKLENLNYSEFNNEKFAKFSLYILQEIKNDFEKYKITFKPILNENNDIIDFKMTFLVNLKIE